MYLADILSEDEFYVLKAKLNTAIAMSVKVQGDLYELSDGLDNLTFWASFLSEQ